MNIQEDDVELTIIADLTEKLLLIKMQHKENGLVTYMNRDAIVQLVEDLQEFLLETYQ